MQDLPEDNAPQNVYVCPAFSPSHFCHFQCKCSKTIGKVARFARKDMTEQTFSNIFLLISTETEGSTLMVSVHGMDFANCGQSIRCRTIGFVLTHRTANNDIIKIENSNLNKPFTIYRSFPMLSNITLFGIYGQPVIKTEGPSQPTHLFEETGGLKRAKVITLRIKNLHFQGMGIIHVINMTSKSNISFENCHIEDTVTGRDIIRIETHSSETCNGLVHFCKCSFINNIALESSGAISVNQIHSVFDEC